MRWPHVADQRAATAGAVLVPLLVIWVGVLALTFFAVGCSHVPSSSKVGSALGAAQQLEQALERADAATNAADAATALQEAPAFLQALGAALEALCGGDDPVLGPEHKVCRHFRDYQNDPLP